MATISITRNHAMTHAAALAAAQKIAADLQHRFGLRYAWDGDRCAFERPGLSGELVVGESEVRLDCTLGFMLSMMKPAIEREVHREFDERFAPPAKRK